MGPQGPESGGDGKKEKNLIRLGPRILYENEDSYKKVDEDGER
jgi:hypothetical protein